MRFGGTQCSGSLRKIVHRHRRTARSSPFSGTKERKRGTPRTTNMSCMSGFTARKGVKTSFFMDIVDWSDSKLPSVYKKTLVHIVHLQYNDTFSPTTLKTSMQEPCHSVRNYCIADPTLLWWTGEWEPLYYGHLPDGPLSDMQVGDHR
jgi:hypothetical protein